MANFLIKTSSFGIELPAIRIEWDAGIEKLWFRLLGLRDREGAWLEGVFKNQDPNLVGTNDPSCQYAVDVIIQQLGPDGEDLEVRFNQFVWMEMTYNESQFYCRGRYSD